MRLAEGGKGMASGDSAQTRMVQRELARRYIDTTMVDVRVMHGIVYVRGLLKHLRTHSEVDLEREADIIRKILRQKPGIREIIWEVGQPH